MPQLAAVECRNVHKWFGTGSAATHALRGITLQIVSGSVTFISGPSGCGKTTLISSIAGLLDPTEGEILVNGIALSGLSSDERARFRQSTVGFVFQQYHLIPGLTVAENVAVPLIVRGVPRRHALSKAAERLDQVQLLSRAGATPAELSGGQQQRVAIARALVHDPTIVICDEPTAALDESMGRIIMDLLVAVGRAVDRTIIIVTHDMRLKDYADAVVRMSDGHVVSEHDR